MKLLVPRRDIIKPSRRLFIAGLGATLAAPAILRAQTLPILGTSKAASGLGLQVNLTGFWSLETTSWTDDTGNGTTLTGNGTPPSAAPAVVGNGVSLNGTTDYLSAASNTNIENGGGSFSVQAWVKSFAGSNSQGVIVTKDNNAFGQKDWGIGVRFTSSNVWSWNCYNTSTSIFNCDSVVSTSSATTHLVVTFDSASGAMKIYVNGSASGAGATLSGTAQSSSLAPMQIGKLAGSFMTGLVDQVGYWKGRILSASDVTALYNSGSGLTYAAMA